MSDTDAAIEQLQSELDELKDKWQKGETAKMAGPLQTAIDLADRLEDDERSDEDGEPSEHEVREREDVIYDTVVVHDLYPFEELKERAFEDAADDLDHFGVSRQEAEVRWMAVEDGVLHYKIEGDRIPTIGYPTALPGGGFR
jgi:hypothetical protein